MIYIKLKFDGNRFTTTCCSKGVSLDVLADNTLPKEKRAGGDTVSDQLTVSEHGTIYESEEQHQSTLGN